MPHDVQYGTPNLASITVPGLPLSLYIHCSLTAVTFPASMLSSCVYILYWFVLLLLLLL